LVFRFQYLLNFFAQFTLSGISSLTLDAIKVDYPDFSSDTCKHNVYYFFADLAGFIAAQILDPAMMLGGWH